MKKRRDKFFHTHAHSHYSCLDAICTVEEMVAKAASMGHKGMGLTDHGNMAGSVTLYKEAKKHGILPFPGFEAYIVSDHREKTAERYHLTLYALNYEGYKALIEISSLSHNRSTGHFHRKPRIGMSDLLHLGAVAGKNIAVSTGCFFGLVQQPLITKGEQMAEAMVGTLARAFPNLFIEFQHHNIDHGDGWSDTEIVTALHGIANKMGLPVIATQDCHYLNQEDKPAHTMLKRMVIHGVDSDDAGFPGDSFHLSSAKWVRKHYTRNGLEQAYIDCQSSYEWLIDNNRMSMPALDDYKFVVPEVSKSPDKKLKKKVFKELERRGLINKDDYLERVEEELRVIRKKNMSNYFLLVEDYVEWCFQNDIFVMARGSVAGSLVCYLLKISQTDPLEWDIPFHRFISMDRQKPPDIDLDIESDQRVHVIDYIRKRFPDLTQIGTFSKLGSNEETGRGSLFVQFLAKMRRELGPDFVAKYGRVQNLSDLYRTAPKEAQALDNLSDYPSYKAPGSHAAGFVMSSSAELRMDDYVPTMLIPSSDTTVTQFVGNDVEDLGFVKIDLLGLRTLSTVKRCLQMIGRRPIDGLEWIPLNDAATMKTIRAGVPENGVFQFEGFSTSKGLKKMKARTTKDCILALALFRPANMSSGNTDNYLMTKARDVSYPHPIFKRHLALTKGIPLFQDQVQDILRDLGMDYERLNKMMKAIKASNENIAGAGDVFREAEQTFYDLAAKAGFSDDDADHAWTTIAGFSEYGFNRAHATAYGLMGYRAAYLKTHYPLEYATAMLETTSGTPKEDIYVREVRRLGIRISRACVNVSGPLWTIDRQRSAIRRGLTSIKGVGLKAAIEIADAQPYTDVNDLIERTTSRIVTGGKEWQKTGELKGVLQHLRQAGALSELGASKDWGV